jgi:hypothetical protein
MCIARSFFFKFPLVSPERSTRGRMNTSSFGKSLDANDDAAIENGYFYDSVDDDTSLDLLTAMMTPKTSSASSSNLIHFRTR